VAELHPRPSDGNSKLGLFSRRGSRESRQKCDGLLNLLAQLLLVDDRPGDGEPSGDFLLGQRFGAGQAFLEPRDGGGVAGVLVSVRPAEIADAPGHVQLTTNVEVHTALLSPSGECVDYRTTVDDGS
jgi:hypothetical protein